MSEQRLRLNENASLNILTRKLNEIYIRMIGKPLRNLDPDKIPRLIAEVLPSTVRELERETDFHIRQLLRLEIFQGRATDITRNQLDDLLRQFKEYSRYTQAYEDFKTRVASKLIESAFDNVSNMDAFKERANQIGIAELSGMKRIVTTESLAAVNWGREQNYIRRAGAEFDRYYWSIRRDVRTSPQCLEVARLVTEAGGNMELQELKETINEVALRYDPKWKTRDWVPHYNCRSLLLRSIIVV